MRLLLPLLIMSMSGACLAQTQHVTDLGTFTLVQRGPGIVPPLPLFSGPETLSSTPFRSLAPEPSTYDMLGMRQVKPGVAEAAAGCKQSPVPPYGCAAR